MIELESPGDLIRLPQGFQLRVHAYIREFHIAKPSSSGGLHGTRYCNDAHRKPWLSVYVAELYPYMVSAELAVVLGAWIVQERCNFLSDEVKAET